MQVQGCTRVRTRLWWPLLALMPMCRLIRPLTQSGKTTANILAQTHAHPESFSSRAVNRYLGSNYKTQMHYNFKTQKLPAPFLIQPHSWFCNLNGNHLCVAPPRIFPDFPWFSPLLLPTICQQAANKLLSAKSCKMWRRAGQGDYFEWISQSWNNVYPRLADPFPNPTHAASQPSKVPLSDCVSFKVYWFGLKARQLHIFHKFCAFLSGWLHAGWGFERSKRVC